MAIYICIKQNYNYLIWVTKNIFVAIFRVNLNFKPFSKITPNAEQSVVSNKEKPIFSCLTFIFTEAYIGLNRFELIYLFD